MINLNTEYGSTAAPVITGYPYGAPANSTALGANDGFPGDQQWGRDVFGFLHALLVKAGISPSGTPETTLVSQGVSAIEEIIGADGVDGNSVKIDGANNKLVDSGIAHPNQDLRATASPTFAAVNTGQGANELYAMDQNVRTSDSPTFGGVTVNGAIVPTASPVVGEFFVAGNSTLTIPRGNYAIEIFLNPDLLPEIITPTGASFILRSGNFTGGMIMSDGSKLRFRTNSSSSATLDYLKF